MFRGGLCSVKIRFAELSYAMSGWVKFCYDKLCILSSVGFGYAMFS